MDARATAQTANLQPGLSGASATGADGTGGPRQQLHYAFVDKVIGEKDAQLPTAEVLFELPPMEPMPMPEDFTFEAAPRRKRRYEPAPRGDFRGGRGRGRGRGRRRGAALLPLEGETASDAAEACPSVAGETAPQMMRTVDVIEAPSATLEGMGSLGTFGSFAMWYAASQSLGVPDGRRPSCTLQCTVVLGS